MQTPLRVFDVISRRSAGRRRAVLPVRALPVTCPFHVATNRRRRGTVPWSHLSYPHPAGGEPSRAARSGAHERSGRRRGGPAGGGAGRPRPGTAGRSSRAGMATAQAGAGEAAIQRLGQRRSLIVRRYVRHGSLYIDNAAHLVLIAHSRPQCKKPARSRRGWRAFLCLASPRRGRTALRVLGVLWEDVFVRGKRPWYRS